MSKVTSAISTFFEAVKSQYYEIRPPSVEDTPWGIKINAHYDHYVERALVNGTYEEKTIEYFLDELVTPDGYMLDIGANIGFYGLLYSIKSGEGSRVDMFEPNPEVHDRLSENIELNEDRLHRTKFFPIAIGEEDTEVTLHMNESELGETSAAPNLWKTNATDSVEVPVKRLDTVYEDVNREPNLVKIDIEGFEINALRGGESFFQTHQPDLLLEVHPTLFSQLDQSLSELADVLTSIGYTDLHWIDAAEHVTVSGIEDLPKDDTYTVHISR